MMLLAECAEVLFFAKSTAAGISPMGSPFGPVSRFRAAGRHLKFLTDTALPYLEERFGAPPTERKTVRCWGTRSARLFALWALTKTEKFGAGASKPFRLLWYPQFLKYLENCPPKKDTTIYLSLGDRERSAARHADGGRLHGEKGEGDFKRSRLQGILRVESRRARQGRHQTLAARRARL